MVPRENKNQCLRKILGDKQRVLWYFWKQHTKNKNLNFQTTMTKYSDLFIREALIHTNNSCGEFGISTSNLKKENSTYGQLSQ